MRRPKGTGRGKCAYCWLAATWLCDHEVKVITRGGWGEPRPCRMPLCDEHCKHAQSTGALDLCPYHEKVANGDWSSKKAETGDLV